MSALRGRPLLVLALAAGAAGAAGTAHAYSGIGRSAVERAVADMPATPAELEDRIEALEGRRKSGDASAETGYALAILQLNRPKSTTLDDPRRVLADVIAADPGYKDALELWTDLIPSEDELRALDLSLRTATGGESSGAARAWALARIAHLLENYEGAEAELVRALGLDAAYTGRVALLRSMMAGEREQHEEATRRFLEALESVDAPTEDLLWRSVVWVAVPDEIEAHKSAFSVDARAFYTAFWKHRDVFPLTEANERLSEHWRRIKRARELYAARSNAYGYFTTHDNFKRLSPDLPYYSSDLVFDYQARMPTWLDHRGLVYIRHGEPDRYSRSSDQTRTETWLYHRWSFEPLMFHFVSRRSVGEFVLTLNLAQALANTTIDDDPRQVLSNTSDFRELYGTRANFNTLFQRMSVATSRYEVEDLLVQEAQMMSAFIRQAWYGDTNNLLKKEDVLQFSAYSANFRAPDGSVEAYVYYAVPEKELKLPGPIFEFDATLVLFSSDWSEKIASAENHFRYEREGSAKRPGKKDLLVGGLHIPNLSSGRYNFAFQVTERRTGKIGIARGRFVADYFGPGWVNLSEPLLAARITPTAKDSVFQRNGQRVVPIPTRTLARDRPAEIYYEIYDLDPGADGKHHYRIETRVLQIQTEAGLVEKLLSLGMNIAGLFFPYEIFLARAGLFGLSAADSSPGKGLDTAVEERTVDAVSGAISESFKIDTKKYPAGIYQVYITVKDYVSGSLNTRSVRFAITN